MKPLLAILLVLAVVWIVRTGFNSSNANARKESMKQDQVTARTIEKATFGAG